MKTLKSKVGNRSPFSIGISAVVVVGSVVGAWLFIESNRTTEVFLVTRQELASGVPLELESLDQVELSLFGLAGAYLQPETLLEGAFLQRPIGSGEAIPLSAITTREQNNWSNLVITPQVPVSAQVGVGSRVSIWAAPMLEFQSYGEPALLAVDVEVVAIIEPEGGFASQQNSLELRVPTESIQYLLGAISSQSLIALTSSGGSS